MTQPASQSVTELAKRLKTVVESSPILKRVSVRGEVAQLTHHRNGHVYAGLTDGISWLRWVWFSPGTGSYIPEEGDSVVITGKIGVYETRGEVQLIAERVQPAGAGELYLRFLEVRERLSRAGLLDPGRKRPLPKSPKRIGVVTSACGAALQDIIQTLNRRFPVLQLTVFPALVQGRQAVESIKSAISQAAKDEFIQVLILARGGGGAEDLWPFNDEGLAIELARFPRPTISAVGHETDITLVDLVADLRAATPTAAAELVSPDQNEITQRFEMMENRLKSLLHRRFEQHSHRMDRLNWRIQTEWNQRLSEKHKQLDGLENKLNSLSTESNLKKGFVWVQQNGKRIFSKSELQAENTFRLYFQDGELEAETVEKVG
jgi:exodeoxyribonuclease VII large subunit